MWRTVSAQECESVFFFFSLLVGCGALYFLLVGVGLFIPLPGVLGGMGLVAAGAGAGAGAAGALG